LGVGHLPTGDGLNGALSRLRPAQNASRPKWSPKNASHRNRPPKNASHKKGAAWSPKIKKVTAWKKLDQKKWDAFFLAQLPQSDAPKVAFLPHPKMHPNYAIWFLPIFHFLVLFLAIF
jgi:hypothetical protein